MSRPYPAPPHVVAGFVVRGLAQDAALQRLEEVLLSAGAATRGTLLASPDGEPLLIDAIFGGETSPVGVELTVSGDLLGMPRWVELEPEDRRMEQRMQRFVHAAFIAACERLDPLYAGVDLEWRIPEPSRLTAAGSRLPGDLFWSSRLDVHDPALATDLEHIYGGPAEPLAGGRVLMAGGLLAPSTGDPPPTLAAGGAAAARLAPAVQRALAVS